MNKVFDLVFQMCVYALIFIVFSVGMVAFRQESMLYHPAVPDERYRRPE